NQESFAGELDLGTTRLRQYESGDVNVVGASGFPISVVIDLARLSELSIVGVMQEIIRRSPGGDRGKKVDVERIAQKILSMFPEEALASRKKKTLGDSEINWALELARKTLLLSDAQRLEVEVEVLKRLVGTEHFGKQETTRFQTLIKDLHKLKT
ncbi:MAG: hypothetical protein M3Q07_19850, partial [Pseudobdellovibrionaceae bacterium]|nr:hypothetical protein [Pseudobdellovibrionaceae bacterium]